MVRVLSTDEYLATLPRPSEVPQVTQDQLRTLYNDDARGLHDEQLMVEVESRFVARLELLIIFTDLYHNDLMSARPPEPNVLERNASGDATVVKMIDGKVVRIPTTQEWEQEMDQYLKVIEGRRIGEVGEVRTEGPGQRITDAALRYDIEPTDWGREEVVEALNALNRVRFGRGSTGERMIAIDRVVNLAHGRGPLADMFIEDEPKDVTEFLDELAGPPTGWSPGVRQTRYRRPEVRVRAHRRRA